MEKLSIRIKVADREYGIKTLPDEEIFLREAGKLIRDQIQKYRELGVKDTQDILAMVALDCLVARLKGDEQTRRLQKMVFDKMTQLDQTITPTLSA